MKELGCIDSLYPRRKCEDAKSLINKEIADRLHISTNTAITHRKNIMDKLHARSLVDVIIYAVINGLVDVGEL